MEWARLSSLGGIMYCWNLRVVVLVSFALGLPLVLEVGIGDLGDGGAS